MVRLGSMGDIIHTLPAVASLARISPRPHIAWVVDPRWTPLLEGNPDVDDLIPFDRRKLASLWSTWGRLRRGKYERVVDFQGLIKSGLVASAAKPDSIYGFHRTQVRERLAALFYSHEVLCKKAHVVDRNIELAVAAGAARGVRDFPLPAGAPEERLPKGAFVLASPLGGWGAKQWPRDHYIRLAKLLRERLGLPLVINGPPGDSDEIEAYAGCEPHRSRIAGLIDATRRAAAVVGIDSGPMHLAAALAKPGVAIFGPTDPARNGPYGDSFTVLRCPRAQTSYKRRDYDESMTRITPEAVCDALEGRIGRHAARAGETL